MGWQKGRAVAMEESGWIQDIILKIESTGPAEVGHQRHTLNFSPVQMWFHEHNHALPCVCVYAHALLGVS